MGKLDSYEYTVATQTLSWVLGRCAFQSPSEAFKPKFSKSGRWKLGKIIALALFFLCPAAVAADLSVTLSAVPAKNSNAWVYIVAEVTNTGAPVESTLSIWLNKGLNAECSEQADASFQLVAGSGKTIVCFLVRLPKSGANIARIFIDSGCSVEEDDEENNQYAIVYSRTKKKEQVTNGGTL